MILGVIFLILPLVIYVVLAALPQGRPAKSGFIIALIVFAIGWVSYMLRVGPLFTGDGFADAFGVAALVVNTGAAIMAGVTQLIRSFLKSDRAIWLYPMIAFGLLILAGFPAVTMLGV